MKKTRITILHQLEKTQHHFMVVNPNKFKCSGVNRKKLMGVEMAFFNFRLYKKGLTVNCQNTFFKSNSLF